MNEILMIVMGSVLSLGTGTVTFLYGYPMLKSSTDNSKFLPHMIHKVLGGRSRRILRDKIHSSLNAYLTNDKIASEIDFTSLQQLVTAVGSAYVFTDDISYSLRKAVQHERAYNDRPSDAFMWEVFKIIRSVRTLDNAEPSLKRGTYTRAEWKREISKVEKTARRVADGKNWSNATYSPPVTQRKTPVQRLTKKAGG